VTGLVLFRSAPCSPRASARGSFLRRLAASLVAWQASARQRQLLRDLDDRALRDVGLSRADIGAAGRDWLSRGLDC
jgi:uncharacterized protein YjiS (DUF1127 family)